MKKSRIEALTDGIVAIAATIMVLELGIPEAEGLAGLVEIRHTFLAYIISFFMIYIVWSMHHDLFSKAAFISRRTFLINGVWIFVLTLVPFTTSWVGASPYDFLPEFLYPLNLLLWSAAFQWLDHQIVEDNPGASKDASTELITRILMYGGYMICMILAFIRPVMSIYVIGISTAALFIRVFADSRKDKCKTGEKT